MLEQYLSQEETNNKTPSSSEIPNSSNNPNRMQLNPSLKKILNEEPNSKMSGSKKMNLNYEKFLQEASKLDFDPINCNENVIGNYDNYLTATLFHISQMKNLKFNYALESPSLYENFPKEKIERIFFSNKKVLLLDLDETLIHADFKEEFLNNENIKYDAIISFVSEKESNEIDDIDIDDDTDSNIKEDKELQGNKILSSVGIFIRPDVETFLAKISKHFEVGIFTAAAPEYADAAINYLDPENKFIKFRLYRNNCINVGDLFRVKDLRILKNISLKNIILVDNNMYSFAPQLNNGILINSFYYDKDDKELDNVYRYLIDYILPADDVRKVNEQFFGFKKILDEMSLN